MHIKVKVKTDSKKESVTKKAPDSYIISVKEPAERGQANKRVVELLRNNFKGYNEIKIISGHHSPSKIISIN